MTHNLSDMEYTILLILYLLIFFLIFTSFFSYNADAYTINKAKNITIVKEKPIIKIPTNFFLNTSTIIGLMNFHSSGGAWAYQSGYAEAVDDILDYLNIKKKTQKSFYSSIPQENKPQICFNYYFKNGLKLFDINTSMYKSYNENSTFYYNCNSRCEKFNNKTIILYWSNVIWDMKNKSNASILTYSMK